MPALYARSALVLCRSGATTVAEVAAVGVPAVFVPWSGAAEGQQDANAAVLVAAGRGASWSPTPSARSTTVEPVVGALLGDPDRRAAMATAAAHAGPARRRRARRARSIEECARAAA